MPNRRIVADGWYGTADSVLATAALAVPCVSLGAETLAPAAPVWPAADSPTIAAAPNPASQRPAPCLITAPVRARERLFVPTLDAAMPVLP